MMPMLTVRQLLTDSALARLPSEWTEEKKMAMVEEVMEVLALQNIADTAVGDDFERGIR